MTDNTHEVATTTDVEAPVPPEPGAENPIAEPDNPHAGIAEAGWSAPDHGAACHLAELTVKRSGAETEHTFPVNPPAVIGRFDPNVGPIDVDLASLPEAAYVSRKHAKITCEDGVWKLTDLGSSNGTFLLKGDFERVEEAELEDGSEFALGNARFVFKLVNGQALVVSGE